MCHQRADLDPTYWGPLVWKVLFLFALSYPDVNPDFKTQNHFGMFFLSLQTVIPCSKCRESVLKYLKLHPLNQFLDSQLKLLKWVTGLYNQKRPKEKWLRTWSDLQKLIGENDSVISQIETLANKYHTEQLV